MSNSNNKYQKRHNAVYDTANHTGAKSESLKRAGNWLVSITERLMDNDQHEIVDEIYEIMDDACVDINDCLSRHFPAKFNQETGEWEREEG